MHCQIKGWDARRVGASVEEARFVGRSRLWFGRDPGIAGQPWNQPAETLHIILTPTHHPSQTDLSRSPSRSFLFRPSTLSWICPGTLLHEPRNELGRRSGILNSNLAASQRLSYTHSTHPLFSCQQPCAFLDRHHESDYVRYTFQLQQPSGHTYDLGYRISRMHLLMFDRQESTDRFTSEALIGFVVQLDQQPPMRVKLISRLLRLA